MRGNVASILSRVKPINTNKPALSVTNASTMFSLGIGAGLVNQFGDGIDIDVDNNIPSGWYVNDRTFFLLFEFDQPNDS